MIPDFLIVGTVTHDERPEGLVIGGTVAYAGMTARNLGYHVAVVTRAGDDLNPSPALDGIQLHRLPSPVTTTFRNEYTETGRVQYLYKRADDIRVQDIPATWRESKIVMLGPLARDVETEVVRSFSPQTLVGVVPQGWMRRWDETARVYTRPWYEAEEILPHARVLVLSEEDLGEFTERLQVYTALTPIVVLTRGARGCTVYVQGHEPFDSPAFKVKEVDPTGAGDVFTAGFLIRLHETNDLRDAARFANCTASFAVESIGTSGLPTREMVEARLRGKD